MSPRAIDTVVNLVDYKGMMTVCNIWEDCKLPDKKWGGIYFNHIPFSTVEQVVITLTKLSQKLSPGGFLIYQSDIQLNINEDWKELEKRFSKIPKGVSRWNEGYYFWLVIGTNL